MRTWFAVVALGLVLSACSSSSLSSVHPDLEVDAVVDFGTVWEGDLAAASFGVRATGDAHVFVRTIASDNPELGVDWEVGDDARGTPIGPGTELRVQLFWEVTAPGVLSSLVLVQTNVPGKELVLVAADGVGRELPDCDDQNPCTDDLFNREQELCEYRDTVGYCDDGNECTVFDLCFERACRGIARTCDDDNVCTQNLCDPAVGCVYPSDHVRCDDGNPCTEDVCEPEEGCFHPDAESGTPCGMFSCATAHVCFFGECREVDVSGASDGLPCADSDPCTEGDACQGGECVSGPLVQRDPRIVATFETFGGEGSTVATDGYRYLFADVDALRLATLGADGALTHVATLPVRSRVAPVLWQPGKFVVAYDNLLALVDATDTAAPRVVWEVAVDGLSGADGAAVHVAAAARGVIYWVGYGATTMSAEAVYDRRSAGGDGPYLLPLDPTTDSPGPAVALAHDPDVRDLDADGRYVAWVSGTAQHWMELDPSGVPIRQAQYPNVAMAPLRKVSVRGVRLAVLGAYTIGLYDVFVSATTDPSVAQFIMNASFVIPGAEDLVLADNELFVLGSEGVVAAQLWGCDGINGDCDLPTLYASDPMIGDRLDRGPGHLLVSGRLALPLRSVDGDVAPAPAPGPPASEGAMPIGMFTRVTGPRHGNVTAMVDAGGTELLVAGPAAIGKIDLLTEQVTAWSLATAPASPTAPRSLHGVRRDALVNHDAAAPDPWGPSFAIDPAACYGPAVETVAVDGTTSTRVLCGLFRGTIDLAASRLYAFTAFDPDIMDCTPGGGVRAWDLSGLGGQPFFEQQTAARCGEPYAWSTRTRIADDQRHVAFASAVYDWSQCEPPSGGSSSAGVACGPQPVINVTVYDLADPGGTPPMSNLVSTWHDGTTPPRDRLATDGAKILLGELTRVVLVEPSVLANVLTPPSLDLPYADMVRPVRIAWMNDGRAWVGYDSNGPLTDDLLADRAPGSYLTQVAYADGGTPLVNEGEVLLPAPADSVVDAQIYTIAATRAGVVVIAPACR